MIAQLYICWRSDSSIQNTSATKLKDRIFKVCPATDDIPTLNNTLLKELQQGQQIALARAIRSNEKIQPAKR